MISWLYRNVSLVIHVNTGKHTVKAISHTPICLLNWTHRPSRRCNFWNCRYLHHPFTFPSLNNLIPGSRAATPTSSSSLRWWSSSSALAWWWSYESEINLDCLIQQLGIVRTINRLACLVQSWVFDQRIALFRSSLASSSASLVYYSHLDITSSAIQVQV